MDSARPPPFPSLDERLEKAYELLDQAELDLQGLDKNSKDSETIAAIDRAIERKKLSNERIINILKQQIRILDPEAGKEMDAKYQHASNLSPALKHIRSKPVGGGRHRGSKKTRKSTRSHRKRANLRKSKTNN